MSQRRKEPGHQQPLYWSSCAGIRRVELCAVVNPMDWVVDNIAICIYHSQVHILECKCLIGIYYSSKCILMDRAPLFLKFLLVRLPKFCNSLIYLYRMKKKTLLKSTCPTCSFTCPGPSGSEKWWALAVLVDDKAFLVNTICNEDELCLWWVQSLIYVKPASLQCCVQYHVDGLVQDCSNSSVLTMELLQSCTKPSMLYCYIRRRYDGTQLSSTLSIPP